MSRSHSIAWAAGFFDGEGYVNIQKRQTGVYSGLYLRIGINHVATEPLLIMKKLFGGSIQKQNPDTVMGNRKQRHRWVCNTDMAKKALIQLIPYLKNKNKVAELALQFQDTMSKDKTSISQDIKTYRQQIKDQIQRLNKID